MEEAELAAHIETLADLDKIVILNKIGRPVVRIGWNIGLFFDGGETLQKRISANMVLRDFLAVCGDKITHYHPSNAERLKKIGSLDLAAYCDADADATTRKSGRNENDMYSADVYGFDDGKEVMEPAPYYLGIVASSRERPGPSHVRANLPISWPNGDDLTTVVEMFIRWCAIIQPAHGTASPGLVLMQGGSSNDVITGFPLLQRFPGLDYISASKWKASIRKPIRKIRTIGWLTALDDGFVEALGGRRAVAAALASEEISIHDFTGGIVIQAGPRPRLGDRNRGDIPAAYRVVAHLLQPLVLDPVPMGMFYPTPESLDPEQETSKWLRRFA